MTGKSAKVARTTAAKVLSAFRGSRTGGSPASVQILYARLSMLRNSTGSATRDSGSRW